MHPHTFFAICLLVGGAVSSRFLEQYVFQIVLTAAVGALPAPTKDSPQWYVFLFQFSNSLIGNLGRAFNTSIEKSPNWEAAADKHVEKVIQQIQQGPADLPAQ